VKQREHGPNDFVEKGFPCESPSCGSSDAMALYSDGHRYCFSCRTAFHDDRPPPQHTPQRSALMDSLSAVLEAASPRALSGRKLTQETCAQWDYGSRQNARGEWEQLAVYRDPQGQIVGVKIRNIGHDGTGKDFSWIGKSEGNLYGRHKWSAGGKRLVITEGEIDCLSVSQAYSHKWPVVSVPNGAAEASKAVAKNLEWIASFDEVVLCFDMDEPGRKAAADCAQLLPPGKAKIAKLPEKDANECLKKGKQEALTLALWNAEPYRPDGIIDARDLTEICLKPSTWGLPWPWKDLTDWTYGRRYGEVYTIGAGTGAGKSDWEVEVVASTISGETRDGAANFPPEACAIFAYEAGAATTKKAIAGKLGRRRFHIPKEEALWDDDELRAVLQDMDQRMWGNGGKLFINDSRGAADWDAVKDRARYLCHAEEVRHFFIDPISALATEEDEERKFLDRMVLEAAKLAVELDACLYLFSHLSRPKDGPSHEEGGQVKLSQFRGSHGIGMFSNFVFGLERNQQAEDEDERCVTRMRSVKDRYTGNSIGKTFGLHYDTLAGTLDTLRISSKVDDE
jgi:twinkle protein